MKTTKNKSICFAYFADNQFIGWYGDTFGSIVPTTPKVYTETNIPVITENFNRKLDKLKEQSTLAEYDSRFFIIDAGLNDDKETLLQYKTIELRVVECPEYDGPNHDFDKDSYDKEIEEYKQKLTAHLALHGIDYETSGPSTKRADLVSQYKKDNGFPRANNWIYADYSKVKEWASKEPTEFIFVIKYQSKS